MAAYRSLNLGVASTESMRAPAASSPCAAARSLVARLRGWPRSWARRCWPRCCPLAGPGREQCGHRTNRPVERLRCSAAMPTAGTSSPASCSARVSPCSSDWARSPSAWWLADCSGSAAGYCGGSVDGLVAGAFDVMLSVPALVLALAFTVFLGPAVRNMWWPSASSRCPRLGRITRAERADVVGTGVCASPLAPGSAPLPADHRPRDPARTCSRRCSRSRCSASASPSSRRGAEPLGAGVRPGTITWGTMIAGGRADLETTPWVVLRRPPRCSSPCWRSTILGDVIRAPVRRPRGRAVTDTERTERPTGRCSRWRTVSRPLHRR